PQPAAPSVSTDTGGSLPPGLYYYALTGIRGAEESQLGFRATVTVLNDEGTVNLTAPDLGDADSYRVWRMSDAEGFWRKFSTSVTTTFTDDGSVTPTETQEPTSNTGVSTYSIVIDLTVGEAIDVQDYSGWSIYRTTTSGNYPGNSLVHLVTERED